MTTPPTSPQPPAPSCPDCVYYAGGVRHGQLLMRCPVCAVIALGGDWSSVQPVALVTAFVKLLRQST